GDRRWGGRAAGRLRGPVGGGQGGRAGSEAGGPLGGPPLVEALHLLPRRQRDELLHRPADADRGVGAVADEVEQEAQGEDGGEAGDGAPQAAAQLLDVGGQRHTGSGEQAGGVERGGLGGRVDRAGFGKHDGTSVAARRAGAGGRRAPAPPVVRGGGRASRGRGRKPLAADTGGSPGV